MTGKAWSIFFPEKRKKLVGNFLWSSKSQRFVESDREILICISGKYTPPMTRRHRWIGPLWWNKAQSYFVWKPMIEGLCNWAGVHSKAALTGSYTRPNNSYLTEPFNNFNYFWLPVLNLYYVDSDWLVLTFGENFKDCKNILLLIEEEVNTLVCIYMYITESC